LAFVPFCGLPEFGKDGKSWEVKNGIKTGRIGECMGKREETG
jgi:hypothetical protein